MPDGDGNGPRNGWGFRRNRFANGWFCRRGIGLTLNELKSLEKQLESELSEVRKKINGE